MRCSMSWKGNCWYNAPAESFFNSLKNERVHGTKYRTHREAMADLFEYIECFTTDVVVIHRSVSCRQFSSNKTGSRLSGQRIRLHSPGPLEGERPGEPQGIAPLGTLKRFAMTRVTALVRGGPLNATGAEIHG